MVRKMREYSFNIEVAKSFGLDEAVFIHAIEFWVKKNQANGRHFHDGRWWTYNTVAALCELFPFWTRRQIERISNSCREKGLIHVGNYSEDLRDRTLWYALDDSILELYGDVECISPNGEMSTTERGNVFHETGKCYKEQLPYQLSNTVKGKAVFSGVVAEKVSVYCGEDQELTAALEALGEARKKAGKAIATERTICLLLNKLDRLSGGQRALKIALLNEAIERGWTTVFPLKRDPPQKEGGGEQVIDEWN